MLLTWTSIIDCLVDFCPYIYILEEGTHFFCSIDWDTWLAGLILSVYVRFNAGFSFD